MGKVIVEPRVLSLDGVKKIKSGTMTFLEDRKAGVFMREVTRNEDPASVNAVFFRAQDGLLGYKFKDYGITWRCWTGYPSRAQMEARRWET